MAQIRPNNITLLLIIAAFMVQSCESDTIDVGTPIPHTSDGLDVSLLYISHNEVAIKCEINITELHVEYSIIMPQNGYYQSVVQQIKDTTIVISDLQPSTKYEVVVQRKDVGRLRYEEERVDFETLPLGLSSINWIEAEWLGYGDNVADVEVVNDSCIYIAGQFGYSGNLAYWNGEVWTVLSIPLMGSSDAIWSSSDEPDAEIWIGNRASLVRCTRNTIFKPKIIEEIVGVRGIWGRNASDVWFCGRQGKVAHWNGAEITVFNLPEELRFYSIIGDKYGTVYAVGVIDNSSPHMGQLWQYENEEWHVVIDIIEKVVDERILAYHMKTFIIGGYCLWVDETGTLYVGGKYLYKYRNNTWALEEALPMNYPLVEPDWCSIDGIGGWSASDYLIAGCQHKVLRYEGVSFLDHRTVNEGSEAKTMQCNSISAAGRTVCIGGYEVTKLNKGYLYIGIKKP